MNYAEYKYWKSSILLKDFIRLDCMNPLISMQELKKSVDNNFSIIKSSFLNTTLSVGTLDTIKFLINFFIDSHNQVYFPIGVYPKYFSITKNNESYKNIPFCIENSIIVLTLNFPNQNVNIDIINKLLDKNNIVIIDAVYDYNNISNKLYSSHPNLFILRSSTKLQLNRSFVIVYNNNLNFINHNIFWDFELEKRINNHILKKWKSTKKLLLFNNIKIESQKGYFSLLNIPFNTLLKKGILGIPYSVFTEDPLDINKTMISCLHESL